MLAATIPAADNVGFTLHSPLRPLDYNQGPKVAPSVMLPDHPSVSSMIGVVEALMGHLMVGTDTRTAITSLSAQFDNGSLQSLVLKRTPIHDEADRLFLDNPNALRLPNSPHVAPGAPNSPPSPASPAAAEGRQGLSAPCALPVDEHSNDNFDAGHLVDGICDAVAREFRYDSLGYLKHDRPRNAVEAETKMHKHKLLAGIESQMPKVMYDVLRALRSLDLFQQGCALKRLDGTPFCAEGLERINEIKLELLMQAHLSEPMCVAGEH